LETRLKAGEVSAQSLLILRQEIEAELKRHPQAHRECFFALLSSVVAHGAGDFAARKNQAAWICSI
jgi:hypothetical protein